MVSLTTYRCCSLAILHPHPPTQFLILPVFSPYTLQHTPLKGRYQVRIFSSSSDADINDMNSEYTFCCVLYFFLFMYIPGVWILHSHFCYPDNKQKLKHVHGFPSLALYRIRIQMAHSTPFRSFYSDVLQSVVSSTQLYQPHLGTY